MPAPAPQLAPLPPAALHILLALAGEDRHGYALMQEVERQSGGSYKLGPGTLYDNLERLSQQGLVRRLAAEDGDSRRRYYRLTAAGKRTLSVEVRRIETAIREARSRLPELSPETAP